MMEVPLPKDHEGREIPLDTEVLYDAKGGEMHVSSYRYQRDVLGLSTGWNVISEDAVGQTWQHPADGLYLNRPDSWKKLEEDLDKDEGVCGYLEKCPKVMDKPSCSECRKLVLRDIASRVRKLRGEVREDA